ncbi:hypothetical protein HYFRA_00011545 [Hymenoscyphus fraxineus]|uniref:Secreted protein n=1 Tax=Hymenoscyphus fraxineus TaxID=746836 RepID=A0A9N9PXB8_9HELO|nr:hypothetical protein HYFRA_00011545 [Hymenoscyphus fraxineus]
MKSFNSIFFVLVLLALISTPTLALPSTPKRLQSRAPTPQEVSDTMAAWTSDINDQNKYITQTPDATNIPDRTDRDIAVFRRV